MPTVTVAIPTRNRAAFLTRALRSLSEQTYRDVEIVVVDNASEDDTRAVATCEHDLPIRYIRNEVAVPMLENWNRCVELAQAPLLVILGDDDALEPHFLEESVRTHESVPTLGFTYTHCEKVDTEGRHIRRWGYEFAPVGPMRGQDYILWSARYGCCLTNSSTAMMRTECVREAEGFKSPLALNSFDFNLWLRLALKHPVCFIDKSLARYTIHDDQVSALHWRGVQQTGKIGTELELIAALSELMASGTPECGAAEVAILLGRANARLAVLLRSAIAEL